MLQKTSYIFLIIIITVSCTSRQKDAKINGDTLKVPSQETQLAEMNDIKPDSSLPCLAIENVDNYLDLIQKNPRAFFNGDDNCVTSLIRSVCDSFIKSHRIKYLDVIASMAEKSDGYVSECLGDELYNRIFIHNPQDFCTYLYSNRNKHKHNTDILFLFFAEVNMNKSQNEFLSVLKENISDKNILDYMQKNLKKYEVQFDKLHR